MVVDNVIGGDDQHYGIDNYSIQRCVLYSRLREGNIKLINQIILDRVVRNIVNLILSGRYLGSMVIG